MNKAVMYLAAFLVAQVVGAVTPHDGLLICHNVLKRCFDISGHIRLPRTINLYLVGCIGGAPKRGSLFLR